MLDITLPAREIFSIGPIAITDAQLGGLIVSLSVIAFFGLASRRFALVPSRIQAVLEFIITYIEEQLIAAFHSRERARAFLPMFVTMLIFLIAANQFMLVPFIFEITQNGADLFRQPTSDFSGPMALSLMIFFISQIMAFSISPRKHLSNFITLGPLLKARSFMDVFQGLIAFGIGLLNIIGEFAKVISLSARLFGNIFAGNVMVAVIISLSSFSQFVVPLPFIVLSVFSGFIQAYVFMLLGVQFIALAIDGATPEEAPAAA